jgi:hypothetical protein
MRRVSAPVPFGDISSQVLRVDSAAMEKDTFYGGINFGVLVAEAVLFLFGCSDAVPGNPSLARPYRLAPR